MDKSGNFAEKWNASLNSTLHVDEVVKEAKSNHSGMEKAKRILNIIARVIFHLRKIIRRKKFIHALCGEIALAIKLANNGVHTFKAAHSTDKTVVGDFVECLV